MPSAQWTVPVDHEHLYFFTAAALNHTHLFGHVTIKRILVDGLNTSRVLGHINLCAFVVMPNHIHVIAGCSPDYPPAKFMQLYKSSTATLLLRHWEATGDVQSLDVCTVTGPAGGQARRAVWEPEYQAKNVFGPEFLQQKLDYIHNNPLQPHWSLADTAEEYPWSSARFYLDAGRAIIPVSDARVLL